MPKARELPVGWTLQPFPYAIDFQEGPGILARDFRPSGIPLIRLSGLDRGGRLLDGCDYLDEQMVREKWSHFRVQQGDILLSTSASLGRLATVDADSVGAIPYTGLIRMRPRHSGLRAPFIRYLLESADFQAQVEAMGSGSVIRHFGPTHLRQMSVVVPDTTTQDAIVIILRALDDKIDLNRRMNETLEEMARALFKSWFVDFDAVRSKAAGVTPFGMDEARSSLFPARLQKSDLGRTPQGWEITTLGEYVSLERGTTYKSSLLGLPGPYLLGLGSMQRNGGFRGTKLKTYGGESAAKLILRPGDLYVSLKDVTQAGDLIGAVARVPRGLGLGRLTQDTVKLNLRDPLVPSSFVYWTIRDQRCREYCRARAIGTTNLSLARLDFLAFPVLRPTTHVLQEFGSVEQCLVERHETNDSQISILNKLRDALLAKLLTGQLRIQDAEKLVGETT